MDDNEGVPACLFTGNNAIHAAVFGQPSERQSASYKPPSMPQSVFGSADSQSPFAKIPASTMANNANSQTKASQPSPRPPSPAPAALDTLTDDQALALLLKNETVAGAFQNAFNKRVEEHQQKVERAYNQRLLELEDYTRTWRDATKELWMAVSEGTINPNKNQQESLSWKGPQEAGQGFKAKSAVVSQETVDKEFDSDGRVTCISVKNPSTSHSESQFNLLNWSNSNGCGSRDFQSFAIPSWDKRGPPRLLFRCKTQFGSIEYRSFTSIDSIIKKHSTTDMVVRMTASNVALLGKAFCYLKDTSDRIGARTNATLGLAVSAAELSFLFERFSSEPTKRLIDVLQLYAGNQRVTSDFTAVNIDVSATPGRLLVARPRYSLEGDISGSNFFDVGSGDYVSRQADEDILIFEDKTTFSRLAAVLCFSINTAVVPISLGGALNDASFVLTNRLGLPSQEWITDIKGGSASHFVSPSPRLMVLMRSPYLEEQAFSKLLESSCGRIFFRLPTAEQGYEYLSLGGKMHRNSPNLRREDFVIELTLQNAFLLWKAFCLLRDRNDYLLSKFDGPLSKVSRKALDGLHDKLYQRYQSSSRPPPGSQIRTMRCVILPEKASGGGVDSQAEGAPFNRKLVIARPYHKGMRVIGAEFFDVGSSARKGRVSAEDIVITEETTTLQDIGRTLEQGIQLGVCPESGAAPQIPQNGRSEQSDQGSTAVRGLFSTGKTEHDEGLGQPKTTPTPNSLPPPQPSLFQRTLDLSDGLRELGDYARLDEHDPQAHSQWLAIGGEPQDVRSPSPERRQERIADDQSEAHDVEEEVPPSGPNTQHIDDNSELIVLDEQPKNVTFRCRRKRPLPAASRKVPTAKRPRASKTEPSMVSERQPPQINPRDQPPGAADVPFSSVAPPGRPDKEHLGQPAPGPAIPLDEQHPVVDSNPRPLPRETMARRTWELQEIQEQLWQLERRIEDDVDQADESPVCGNIETSGQLQADGASGRTPASGEMTASLQLRENLRRIGCRFQDDIDKDNEDNVRGKAAEVEQLQKSIGGSEPMPETQRQIANTQANLRPAAHLPSFGVPNQTNVPSGDPDSLSTAQERVADPQNILTDQSQSTPTKGDEMCEPSQSPAHEAPKPIGGVRSLRRG